MVEGEGFEPSKAVPPDLQSGPVDRLGNPSKREASHFNRDKAPVKLFILSQRISAHDARKATKLHRKSLFIFAEKNTFGINAPSGTNTGKPLTGQPLGAVLLRTGRAQVIIYSLYALSCLI